MSDAGGAGAPAGHQEVLAGRYRLVRRLAEGGMAAVWEGRDEILARPVAVKIPHPQLASDPAYRERFRREAVAAARLAHPGIVATYDTGADGAVDFIVMELVPGRTVRDLVAEGPVPQQVAVPIVAQVAEALDAAHQAGIVHRDIKPANLLLVDDGPVPRVKVADFGVARAKEVFEQGLTESSVTREGVVLGTARYLAPEQVSAGDIDPRTDIYAVGCVLHELLAGKPPFVRDNDMATALAHLTEPPPPLRSLGVAVDPALEGLVLACLAKDPQHRPASARALADELRTLSAPPGGHTASIAAVDRFGSGAASRPPSSPSGRGGARSATSSPGQVSPTVALPTPPPPQPAPARRSTGAGPPPSRHGTRSVRRPTRSRAPIVVVGCLVVAALATALIVLAVPTTRPGGRGGSADPSVPAGPPAVAAVRSFDPAPGDGRENDDELGRLTDRNPSTSWSSDRYRQPPVFGNLKKGLGLVVTLRQPARLGTLQVRSTSRGWAAQVYVAATPAPTLSGWGQPVARASGIDGDLEVDLKAKSGGAVLVWFTDPGRTGQIVVGELELRAP